MTTLDLDKRSYFRFKWINLLLIENVLDEQCLFQNRQTVILTRMNEHGTPGSWPSGSTCPNAHDPFSCYVYPSWQIAGHLFLKGCLSLPDVDKMSGNQVNLVLRTEIRAVLVRAQNPKPRFRTKYLLPMVIPWGYETCRPCREDMLWGAEDRGDMPLSRLSNDTVLGNLHDVWAAVVTVK